MIKEKLKQIGKKLVLVFCVSAMCIGGGVAISAQAAELNEIQESDAGRVEIASVDEFLNFGQVVSERLDGYHSYMYEVRLSKSGRVDLAFESYDSQFFVKWYDSDGDYKFQWAMDYNETLGFAKDGASVNLIPGTYYIEVYNYHGDTGTYKMRTTFENAGANEKEQNNDYKTAMPIIPSQLIKAQLAYNDSIDLFKFRVTTTSKVYIKIESSQLEKVKFELFDQNGDWQDQEYIYANDVGNLKNTLIYELKAGIYYIGFERYSNTIACTGSYYFKVLCPLTLGSKNVTLSKSKYEYDGKIKTPSVIVKNNSGKCLAKGRDYDVYAQKGRRNVGIYRCKVVFKGNYKGSVTKTITIVPARTKITGIANKNNGIKIAWGQRSASNATGYIVYRSVNGGAYKKIKVIRNTRTTEFTDTMANSWGDTYSYKVIVYKNIGGKTYKSPASNGRSVYRY